MITMSCSLILFPWSRPPSRNSVGPASSRSWTCGAPISLFVYGKATSGSRRSLPPQATMNTGSCRMAFPAPPSVFQGFMNEVFRVFLHRFVIVYIDDILIYSRNLAEHRHHVTQVLRQLRKHHLYLKLEKCEFHRPTVQFLGYILSADGIQMDQGKVQAIRDWPQPQSVKELQRFLWFANFYQRLIQNFSLISAPLTSMIRQKPKSLLHCSILSHPELQLPFIVEMDTSTTGMGAVLSQYHGEPIRLYPCTYFSRMLSPAEPNYVIGNWELLAI